MRIVALSDTHGQHRAIDEVPDGDVFVFTGDMCRGGDPREVEDFFDWATDELDHDHKILIAGNHDYPFEETPDPTSLVPSDFTYLEGGSVDIEGVEFWGGPWQPEFCNWAFNLERGEPLAKKWSQIPDSTDVLLTHGPPHGIKDGAPRRHPAGGGYMKPVGCQELWKRVIEVQPDLHVFGHIHEQYGLEHHHGIEFLNASYVGTGDGSEKPFVLDL